MSGVTSVAIRKQITKAKGYFGDKHFWGLSFVKDTLVTSRHIIIF